MQKEFIGNNLLAWLKDIKKAYETGVKLVKVNALGYKFIRILTVKDMVRSGEGDERRYTSCFYRDECGRRRSGPRHVVGATARCCFFAVSAGLVNPAASHAVEGESRKAGGDHRD